MSTHSLCGAQPDVQLHHEHVVANSLLRGWVKYGGKHFKEEESDDSKGAFIKTEENCKNQTSARSWTLHRDGMRQLLSL